ncbi:hypothetical protein M408DRAFT_31248 [Serendipita vermifera MAFF 305830]|uniref:Uncharacterized protein n=1 Tax=Serendipita vermifera MAFF 305830 TaxID=933852 RepID=A0A0C2WP15_SERVB|nr:hypothetical protein M408DRAFT_31248 [Serendipita vermifera MAFF 305830]
MSSSTFKYCNESTSSTKDAFSRKIEGSKEHLEEEENVKELAAASRDRRSPTNANESPSRDLIRRLALGLRDRTKPESAVRSRPEQIRQGRVGSGLIGSIEPSGSSPVPASTLYKRKASDPFEESDFGSTKRRKKETTNGAIRPSSINPPRGTRKRTDSSGPAKKRRKGEKQGSNHIGGSRKRQNLDEEGNSYERSSRQATPQNAWGEDQEIEWSPSSYRFFQPWDDVWRYTRPSLDDLVFAGVLPPMESSGSLPIEENDRPLDHEAPAELSEHLLNSLATINTSELPTTAVTIPFFGRLADLDLRHASQGPPDSDEGSETGETREGSESAKSEPLLGDELAGYVDPALLQETPDGSTTADPVDEPEAPAVSSPLLSDWKVPPSSSDSLAQAIWDLASSGRYLEATRALPAHQRCQVLEDREKVVEFVVAHPEKVKGKSREKPRLTMPPS